MCLVKATVKLVLCKEDNFKKYLDASEEKALNKTKDERKCISKIMYSKKPSKNIFDISKL